MKLRRRIAVAAVLGLAAACTEPQEARPPTPVTPSPQPQTGQVPPVGYACESGQTVDVRYPDSSTAQVTYRDQTYTLRSAPSASGARYAGSGLEWWTATREGRESATLSRLDPNEDVGVAVLERCGRASPDSASTGAQAPLQPAPASQPSVSTPCRGPQLKLAEEGGDAGAGNRVTVLSLQNIGTQACSLTGYPGLTLQDARGRAVAAVRTEQKLGGYFRQGQVPAPVELAPQGKAYFDLAWNVVPHEGQGETACPSVARLRVTAPSDTSAVSLDESFTPCGGRVQISPVRPVAEPTPQPDPPAATTAR